MMHKEHIAYIIEHGTEADMHELKDLMDEAICDLKRYDKDTYLCYEYMLANLAHHGHMCEELAKQWVSKMENKDGSCGAHWSWEDVQQVKREKGIDMELADLYAILNMVYSDFYNPKFDTSIYIELAKDWLKDKDIEGSKLLKYYYFVVCAE